jgi:hypothetical protein
MTAYYGGRCECKIRKVPTRVTTLDFTSMYPTVTMLLDLWKFIIAEDIETKDVTEEIKVLLNNINLPYIPLLKAEKVDMWFYGIASKRYALYNLKDNKIEFMEDERSFKLHGLGHLTTIPKG